MTTLRAASVPINWHSGLPIFASEPFLKAVGDEYGWIGGIDERGDCCCVLPYTIVHKLGVNLVRFRVETIPLREDFGVAEEKRFLTSAMAYLKTIGGDVVIPASTNTVFRTYPEGAVAAPYGSYVIDLRQAEEKLWHGINHTTRKNINTAARGGVTMRIAPESVTPAYALISETFHRSKLPFMNYQAFLRFLGGLGEYGRIMVAECEGKAQSYAVLAFSRYCAYGIYAGNIESQQPGANKLLYWEAIRYFHNIGVQKFDFVGARLNPPHGSKQEGISLLKKHFGTTLKQGYMWKYALRPLRSRVYGLGVKLLRGGDIVDAEHHKLATTPHGRLAGTLMHSTSIQAGLANTSLPPKHSALIVNADDWGRDRETTDRILDCVLCGSVSSASAMVFMPDSERAADLALEHGIDTGLHLNFTTAFSASTAPAQLQTLQEEIGACLRRSRLSQVVFRPRLARAFEYVVAAQLDEFAHLYGKRPARIDGHHHMHLCANVVFGQLLPAGTVVRRNLSFQRGEKSLPNRLYRNLIDHQLARRHRLADYLFFLPPMEPVERLQRIFSLAREHWVEVETHPVDPVEYRFLTSGEIRRLAGDVPIARGYCIPDRGLSMAA